MSHFENCSIEKMKDITIFEDLNYDNDFITSEGPPRNLVKFIDWLNSKFIEIPAEYLNSAYFHIESEEDYESSVVTLRIGYERPETPEEEKKRKLSELDSQAYQKKQDLRRLRDLQAKYPDEAVPGGDDL